MRRKKPSMPLVKWHVLTIVSVVKRRVRMTCGSSGRHENGAALINETPLRGLFFEGGNGKRLAMIRSNRDGAYEDRIKDELSPVFSTCGLGEWAIECFKYFTEKFPNLLRKVKNTGTDIFLMRQKKTVWSHGSVVGCRGGYQCSR